MLIMNPAIVVKKSSWLFRKFGFIASAKLTFAQEYSTATTRSCSQESIAHKNFKTLDEFKTYVKDLRSIVKGASVSIHNYTGDSSFNLKGE